MTHYVELQVLTHFSLLRGASGPDELFAAAALLGYPALGVSDIGLTILAHGCKRLVKLELSGCEGSYDGISAIGRCCLMLEELTFSDHRMDAGWIAGLSYCGAGTLPAVAVPGKNKEQARSLHHNDRGRP